MTARCRLVLATLGLLAACGRDRLPDEIAIERTVSELAPPLAAPCVAEGAVGVRRAVLEPGARAKWGGPRDALVTPPGTTLRCRLDVPPAGALRFSVAVDGDKQRDESRSGIEFSVAVNGTPRFTLEVNPAARNRQRRWLEGSADLGPWAGQTVEAVLATRALDPGRAPAGTAGWSHVRLVQETRRTRQRASAGPNVLVLLVDTLRADRLGAYGAAPSRTPAFDAFAQRGLVFDVAVAQSSWTMPSVASIFSGLYPRSHGAVGPRSEGGDAHTGAGTLLPDAIVTLAELAQDAGISTAGVSSNLLIGRGTNVAQGFEHFVEMPFDAEINNYVPASTVNRRFLDWLRGASDVRWLAYLHYMDVHGPYAPPGPRPAPPPGMRPDLAAGHVDRFARAVNAGSAAPPSPAEVAYLSRLYDGDVAAWDDAFGGLIRHLAADGTLDRTIVIVTADHGEEFLEHGDLTHGDHLYEEAIRVPLVMAGPGIPVGRRQDVAQGIDLLPTITSLLGLAAPPGLEGRNLLDTSAATPAISEIVSGFGEHGTSKGTVALRTARWKLIRVPESGTVELYDLARDPAERTNLAAGEPEAKTLAAELDRWAAKTPPPPAATRTNPELRDRLRQLGYVD